MFWNPFVNLGSIKNYPLAKIRRSTFFNRLSDTFEVVHGNISSNNLLKGNINHLGIIDYLIFPILFPLAYALNKYAGEKIVLVIIFTVVKLPFTVLITLAVSPLVAGFHLIRLLINAIQDISVKALKVTGNFTGASGKQHYDTTNNLSDLVDDIDILYLKLDINGSKINIKIDPFLSESQKLKKELLKDMHIEVTKENSSDVLWMCKSNFGKIASNFDEVEGEELENFFNKYC